MNEAFSLNGLDYFFLIVTLFLVIVGCLKGFVLIFLSLLSFSISGFLSVYAYPYVRQWISGVFARSYIEQVVAASLSYFVILIALLLISSLISNKIKKSSLSDVNRVAGALVGLAQGIVIPVGLCAILIILNIDYPKFDSIKESRVMRTMFNVVPYIPSEIMNSDSVLFLRKCFGNKDNNKTEDQDRTEGGARLV